MKSYHHSTLPSTSYINTYLQDEDAVTSRRYVAVFSKVMVILLILQQSVHCKENTLQIKKKRPTLKSIQCSKWDHAGSQGQSRGQYHVACCHWRHLSIWPKLYAKYTLKTLGFNYLRKLKGHFHYYKVDFIYFQLQYTFLENLTLMLNSWRSN